MEKALEFFRKNYKVTNFLIKNTIFAFLILLVLHFSNVFDINFILRFRYVMIVVFSLLTFLLFLFFEKEKEKKEVFEKYFKISFLVGLVLITIGSLDFQTLRNFEIFNALINLIHLVQNYVVLLTIISGFFTFYFNSERIEKEIEVEEKKRKR